jgi:hypothetical protein
MPTNAMNVGADYNITYFDGNSGALVVLGDVQDVRITAQKHDIKTMPYNQVPRYDFVPDGFKIDFTMTRSLPILENLMMVLAAAFNSGGLIQPGVLNQTTQNSDGSVSRYQYTNFRCFLTDHGNISRDRVVTQRLEGWASDKLTIA